MNNNPPQWPLHPDETSFSEYKGLLLSLARRLTRGYASAFEQDLIQAGYVGLLNAMTHYHAEKNVKLTTYAVPWILGEMKRALRIELSSDGGGSARRRLQIAAEAMRREHGHEPTTLELSRQTGMEPYLVSMLMETTVSVDEAKTDEHMTVCSSEWTNDFSEITDLRSALNMLATEERQVILLRYYRDKTQKQTAETLGRSQSYVSKTEQRALNCIRAFMDQ